MDRGFATRKLAHEMIQTHGCDREIRRRRDFRKSGAKATALQTLPRRTGLPKSREAFGVRRLQRRFPINQDFRLSPSGQS